MPVSGHLGAARSGENAGLRDVLAAVSCRGESAPRLGV